jgi:mono/diheme cytochrome c family protein
MRRWLPFVLILLLAIAALRSGRQKPSAAGVSRGGAVLYTRYCATCHGETGAGRDGMTDLRQVDWSPAKLRRIVRRGHGRMPPAPIGGGELDSLLLYVRDGL